jgi:hypothetical protein
MEVFIEFALFILSVFQDVLPKRHGILRKGMEIIE